MDFSILAFFFLLSVLTAYYANRLLKTNVKRKRIRIAEENESLRLLELQRQKDRAYVEKLHPEITKLNSDFEKLLQWGSGYFNNNKLLSWKSDADATFTGLSKIDLPPLGLDSHILAAANQLINNFSAAENIRKKYNNEFVARELQECDELFSNVDNASLDEQQRLAIVMDEDNNLVIAGAGSGKTTTVAGKVSYLVKRGNVKPEEILLITFTRKAAEEMRDRIKNKMSVNIEVDTFHSFGRKVIGEVTRNMPSVIEEKEFYNEMKIIFKELMVKAVFAEKVIKFITEHRLEFKEPDDFNSHGDYINYLKDHNIKSYKTIETVINGRVTILRETCKSIEEVKIANFLFLNGVEYKYEEPYQHPTADNVYSQYKPDFYLPKHDLYIEHFGVIDEDYNVPHWFSAGNFPSAKEKYKDGIDWKRQKHEEHQTKLIETYSYENRSDKLLENLQGKLQAEGIVLKPRPSDEVWGILNAIAKDDVSALDSLISTFLNLFKSNNYVINDLRAEINKQSNSDLKNRYLVFLSIFEPILNKYNEYLKQNNLMDFSDMINQAADYIIENKFASKYKYIIIDEFQDTSIGRYHLVKSLLNNNKSCKLFAVGDDWQSIYRFAGSDISLFTEFATYFGVTEISRIETTYRFGNKMIDLSSKFILKNPNQTTKRLRPYTVNATEPIEFLYSDSFSNDDPQPFIEALRKINSVIETTAVNVKIIALSRYNHFIKLYQNRTDLFNVSYDINSNNYRIVYRELPQLSVEYLTVHRSKGLQADYVIVLNCVSGQYGFPSEQADDPVLNLLLSKSDQFINGEERRLFYVALTRAKKKTFITSNSSYTSKFVKEIDPDLIPDPISKCPVCKAGDKIRAEGINKYGRPYVRFTCSNWKYDCDYLEWG